MYSSCDFVIIFPMGIHIWSALRGTQILAHPGTQSWNRHTQFTESNVAVLWRWSTVVKWLWALSLASFMKGGKKYLPSQMSGFCVKKKKEWNGRKRERERKRVRTQRAYPCLHFHPVSTGLIPTSCQLTRLTAILAERHRVRGTLIHPLPLSPCLSLSAPE